MKKERSMTKKQKERLYELENEAIDNYLNYTDFDIIQWIDEEKEQKEYCELYNMQFNDKDCQCGTHKNWQ